MSQKFIMIASRLIKSLGSIATIGCIILLFTCKIQKKLFLIA